MLKGGPFWGISSTPRLITPWEKPATGSRLAVLAAGGHESEHERYRAPRWSRGRAASPPERSILPVVGRQGPEFVTQFEAFLAVFGAEPTLGGSRLAGRPRAER